MASKNSLEELYLSDARPIVMEINKMYIRGFTLKAFKYLLQEIYLNTHTYLQQRLFSDQSKGLKARGLDPLTHLFQLQFYNPNTSRL